MIENRIDTDIYKPYGKKKKNIMDIKYELWTLNKKAGEWEDLTIKEYLKLLEESKNKFEKELENKQNKIKEIQKEIDYLKEIIKEYKEDIEIIKGASE